MQHIIIFIVEMKTLLFYCYWNIINERYKRNKAQYQDCIIVMLYCVTGISVVLFIIRECIWRDDHSKLLYSVICIYMLSQICAIC